MILYDWMLKNDIWPLIIAKGQGKTYLQYMSAEDFSDYMRLNWGDRFVFPKMENVDLDRLAKQIIQTKSTKWDELFKFINIDVNLAASATHKTRESYSGNTERDTAGQQNNKVSGFNTTELITDTGADNTGNEKSQEDYVKDYVDDTFDIKTAIENLPLIEKTNIINVVVKDVVNYLTISIY